MLTREEFGLVVDSLLADLRAVAAGKSIRQLQELPSFYEEYLESIRLLKDPETQGADYLPLAFGVIDTFVRADWEEVISGAYNHYKAVQRARRASG